MLADLAGRDKAEGVPMSAPAVIFMLATFLCIWVLAECGSHRCQFCKKMRLDGHKKDCRRWIQPKVREY
jgi:hypothetical protein